MEVGCSGCTRLSGQAGTHRRCRFESISRANRSDVKPHATPRQGFQSAAGRRRYRLGSMAVQAWFVQEDTTVRPGTSTSLSVVVENVGDRTETYTIIPAGLSAAWTTVTRPNVTLFGGSRDVIEVTVRPPAIPSMTSGPTAVAVRVLPQSDPDESTVSETIITVSPFDDRRITMLQPLQRGRRRATYEFPVDNHGNNLASCRLHLVDASGRVDGSFDPPAVGVAPGASSLVRLRLRARRRS